MKLTPLSDRVLIKPDQAPQVTASGLHLAEHWKPEQTGTVVAVGFAKHPRKAEAEAYADTLDNYEIGRDAAQLLRELVAREPLVKEGDYVIFSWQAGQEIFVNDGEERYLLMREADLIAVLEPDPAEVEGSPV